MRINERRRSRGREGWREGRNKRRGMKERGGEERRVSEVEGMEEIKFCIYARPKEAGYHQELPSGALPKEFSVKASCCG